jgi:hypothetical protein
MTVVERIHRVCFKLIINMVQALKERQRVQVDADISHVRKKS